MVQAGSMVNGERILCGTCVDNWPGRVIITVVDHRETLKGNILEKLYGRRVGVKPAALLSQSGK